MGKKRKQEKSEEIQTPKEEENPRPKRTLLGWKTPPQEEKDKENNANDTEKRIFRNREKILVICSRRIVYRYRHLMMDIVSLLPHCKKDNKVESKENKGATLNELVELRNCTGCLFFECRKRKDLYLWMAKCPNGPSVKFLVNAVHTMEELKLTGNHLKGSRPVLTFASDFDTQPHWQLLKEIITQIFGTPKDHRKAKPFFDHVFVFSIVDNHIWFRNYQISVPHHGTEKIERGGLDKMTLIEVGPRFCLNPIKIFSNSFTGQTLYENPFYISPNQPISNLAAYLYQFDEPSKNERKKKQATYTTSAITNKHQKFLAMTPQCSFHFRIEKGILKLISKQFDVLPE